MEKTGLKKKSLLLTLLTVSVLVFASSCKTMDMGRDVGIGFEAEVKAESPEESLSRLSIWSPDRLLTEFRRNPAGLEVRRPGFSWRVNLPDDNQAQTTYQVVVAESYHDAWAGRGTVWDSGKINSSQSTDVLYAGRPLKPAKKYFWSVRTWGIGGELTAYSEPASFITALWDKWQAKWIWADVNTDNQHIYLRKPVKSSARPVKQVLAFVSADDFYKLYLNGELVGMGPCPSFPKEYNYNTIDLTADWKPGEQNMLAVHAFYQGVKNERWVSGDGRRGFILQLEITFADGSKQIIVTDPTWRFKICRVYTGRATLGYQVGVTENIDAREIPLGWKLVDFDDSDWASAVVQDRRRWKLHAQETDILMVHDEAPVKVVEKAKGHYFFDLGHQVVGTLRLRLTGQAGHKVEIRLAEELAAPETAKYVMRCNTTYQDFWTLRDGEQEIEFYDYRGFRYGEIINSPSPLDEKSITAVVRHYPFDEDASGFRCSNRELNALWKLCKYTIKMGAQDMYLDPVREKAQYVSDTYLDMSTAGYLAGEWNLGRRMLELSLQSSPIGKIKAVSPCIGVNYWSDDTMLPVLTAWRYYRYTGDLGFLIDNYKSLASIEHYMRTSFARSDGLLCNVERELRRTTVDHPRSRRDGFDIRAVNIATNAYYYRIETLLAKIARLVAKNNDAAKFSERARQVRESINRKLWDDDRKCYLDGMDEDDTVSTHSSLHANGFALATGIVLPERVDDTIAYIKTRGLKCNMFFAILLFEALYDYGAGDWAYDALMAEGDVETLTGRLLEVVMRQIGVEQAALLLLDQEADELHLAAAAGRPEEDMAGMRFPAGEGGQ